MRKFFMIGAALPLLFLTGCGDGWEMRSYDRTPYGNRTAGSGVEYVRASLMPERGPKVDKVKIMEKPKEEVKEAVKHKAEKKDDSVVDKMLNSGEKFFRDLQKK